MKSLILLVFLLSAIPASAAPRQLLSNPAPDPSNWGGRTDQDVAVSRVETALPGKPRALRIEIKRRPESFWDIQLSQPVDASLAKGCVMRLRFMARSRTSSAIVPIFEHRTDPYEKWLSTTVRLSPAWKEYAFVFTAERDIPESWAALRFQLGTGVGEFELTGISLDDYGRDPRPMPKASPIDPFGGVTAAPGWEKAAEARIERIRKGNLHITVIDAHAKPIPGATVKVAMKRHAFRFGTAITDGPLFAADRDGQKYRETLLRLFNCVVLENQLKWGNDPDNGFAPGTAERMLDWCEAHHLAVRGHNLVWPGQTWLPENVRNLTGDALRQAVHDRVTKQAARTRGRVYVWDVVNEAVANHYVQDQLGPNILNDIFQWAHEADPNALLAYNEYNILNNNAGAQDGHRAAAAAIIRRMLDHKAPLTSLGVQSHMSVPLTHGDRLVAILDEWQKFGLPVEVTEYDAAITDDATHAAYLREFMTAIFSHPAIHSFLMWGFWEKAHWLGDKGGAMYRADWSPRPAVAVYEDLVFHKWWTNARARTNARGEARVRGFLGDYEVTAVSGARSRTVKATLGKTTSLRIKLD